MTIRHMQIFRAVAETGKVGAAARRLYLAQPTVSKAIAEIEKEYRIFLFERQNQRLYITEAGVSLLHYVRRILGLYDEMEAEMRGAAGVQTIRLGATITAGSCVLPGLVRAFEESSPGTRVQVEVESAVRIEQKILYGDLDLALSEGKPGNGELTVEPAMEDELVFICGPDDPLAGEERLPVSALNGRPFILREEGSGTRACLDGFLSRYGLQVYPKWICQSFDALLRAVEEGQGVSAVSSMWVSGALKEGRLHRLKLDAPPLTRSFWLLRRRGKRMTPAMERLRGVLLQTEGKTGLFLVYDKEPPV